MNDVVLTGDRPTGPLHLGHYFGSLANRVRLQDLHPMYVLIADYQVITDRDLPGEIRRYTTELLLDYLAVGLDPAKVTIFQHSAIPELNQLLLPFLSLVSVAELRRNPTVKDEIAHSSQSAVNGLMFTYPVHQAADILFCKGTLVPVGKDQLPHLEVARLVARRFNERYGEVFPLPEAMMGAQPLLRGLDGGKMSKSRGNAIALSATEDETAALIRKARTDAERLITFDEERRPEVANLLTLAGLCLGRGPAELAGEIGDGGAVTLKRVVTEAVNEFLRPIRKRRAELAGGDVRRILAEGNERARERAVRTLEEVQAAMGF
ncbi:tryptophanyl-tRNA synthetase [Nonomuraea thailandensis]|uniref:Tryptophan--tRNA ligase n=1 Tax=Nonomuraea thailandensis TaxID=1188745 RepID=A0A9X2K5G9_9ACTN|nr:tryptophan--tRNA ligase [Nonomuraea thailandensis]MCP2361103.1 tryptophanyl-tRNA synthetase [Nonomuraea thailandensis]